MNLRLEAVGADEGKKDRAPVITRLLILTSI